MGFDNGMIGMRIKKAREGKGLTQEALAEHLEVSNAYVSKIERGKTALNLDTLSKITMLLEQTSDYILTGADTSSADYMRNEIVEMLQGCSAEKIKLIAQIIKPIIEYKE
ncbi:helix-turn-helix domain-containing protein [Cohnella soli]|uniref:Helix-turn-helix domain-containing protein n=1 Tax=Cohnella soli TaxID=425005 RepID=A0ABW0HSZ2_9BACL